MTREQILAMEAGEAMDNLVAERVMGWVSRSIGGPWWYPSTYIAPVWQVADKMGAGFNLVRATNDAGEIVWGCRYEHPEDENGCCVSIAWAPTAPLAICRAALLQTLEATP
jgi:hypothetical protein